MTYSFASDPSFTGIQLNDMDEEVDDVHVGGLTFAGSKTNQRNVIIEEIAILEIPTTHGADRAWIRNHNQSYN